MMTYTPPPVWQPKESGGKFASINRPVSGATHEAELPSGEHPYQLHSLATPNGVKVTVLLEELIEAGHDVEYDAWIVQIGEGEQFSSGFLELNPNSKIPALLDRTGPEPVRVFESGAIMLHLAERHDAFLGPDRPEMLSWLMWQMGSAPFLGGGFGHFEVVPDPRAGGYAWFALRRGRTRWWARGGATAPSSRRRWRWRRCGGS